MSGLTPRRTNPDRKAAKKYARSQRHPHIPTTGPDPNAQFLAEQSLAGGGGWVFSIYRLMRRLIVGHRD
jgi:hypothetical protein